jgi:starvation-inducible DNA-binding protein
MPTTATFEKTAGSSKKSTRLTADNFNDTAKRLGIEQEKFLEHKTHLEQAFRNTYDIYIKTWFYHWNFRGTSFLSVHQFLDDQYVLLASNLDEIAERLKMLGLLAPMPQLIGEAQLHLENEVPLHNELLQTLRDDHYTLATQLRSVVEVAEEVNDVVTADLITELISQHEKAAWFCNASLEQ